MEGAITNIVMVADKAVVPPGYEVIEKSKDRGEDCDLWKDNFFGKRITRYICYTRSQSEASFALGDICILDDKQSLPTGFTTVDHTWDTREKALKKKSFHVKWLPLVEAKDAVTDILILSRAKKAPHLYQIAGDINNLLICFKYGPARGVNNQMGGITLSQDMFQTSSQPPPLPYSTQPNDDDGFVMVYSPGHPQFNPHHPTLLGTPGMTPTRPAPTFPHTASGAVSPGQTPPQPLQRQQSTLRRSECSQKDDYLWAIQGVPFEISSRVSIFQRLENFYIPETSNWTEQEMKVLFDYSFESERRCITRDF